MPDSFDFFRLFIHPWVLGLDIDVQVGFKALTDHSFKRGEIDRLVVVEVDTLVLITIVSKGIVCNLILATCGQSHTREPWVQFVVMFCEICFPPSRKKRFKGDSFLNCVQ